jgi:thiol-disulfide isomerase/thioredoxin
MSLVLLDQSPDSITVGWGFPGQSKDIEIKVNEGESKVISVNGGVVKKKNLSAGDEVSIRLKESDGRWGPFHTFKMQENLEPHPPPPRVQLEISPEEPSAALALVEFDPIALASKYEVAMFPLDGYNEEWVKVSDAITSTAVRKKNLRANLRYSFKYRGWIPPNGWGPWSAASVPEIAPERNLVLQRAIAPKLMRVDGSIVDTSSLSGKVVLLYFSASWCGPCRQFTPRLVEFYNSMKAMGKPIEVVFVSADQDEHSFNEYFHKMGWLAVPFHDPRREDLSAEHGIRGIPSLRVISSKTGKVVEADAIRYPLSVATLDAWHSRM